MYQWDGEPVPYEKAAIAIVGAVHCAARNTPIQDLLESYENCQISYAIVGRSIPDAPQRHRLKLHYVFAGKWLNLLHYTAGPSGRLVPTGIRHEMH